MGITNVGRGLIRDAVSGILINGGIGLDDTTFSSADTGLFGGGTTINTCDTSTAWVTTGDAQTEVLNTTSGEFLEGTGCLNIPYTNSTGVGSWSQTYSATTLTSKKVYLWFYINLATDLTDSSSAITVSIANTSSFASATTNEYYTSRDSISNGWNSIYLDIDSADLTGSSISTSSITDIKLTIEADISQTGNSMRMDYWRSYESGTLGMADSIHTLTKETGNYYVKTIHSIPSTESNGLAINEAGDTNGTSLISRTPFATLDKGTNTELQVDKYYYIESE